MKTILEMKNIEKSFSGVKALKKVSLTVHEGEILAVLGENGAGKSTLMKILTGVYKSDKGKILYFGKTVHLQNYKEAQQLGISIIFQELSLIPHLSVWENIFLGNEIYKHKFILNKKAMRIVTKELLGTLGIGLNVDDPVQNLSIAEQQFVEIAKALSVKVKILILDEPTSTLTIKEAEKLFEVMRTLQKQGVGMVFISHHLDELYQIADDVMILRDGVTIDQQPIKQLTREALIEKVVGRSLGLEFPNRNPLTDKKNILEVKNMQISKDGPTINFSLKKGEILGFFGLVGAGRTEIMRALLGIDRCVHKEVFYKGTRINISNPSIAYNYGIGLLPEDRKSEGLLLSFSVLDNISLNNLPKGVINYNSLVINSIEKIKMLSIKTPDSFTPVINLSGGNQQKVIIARWLSTNCDILIFDEPTRGIDVGAKAEIYKIMDELTKQGKSIIMISSEMEEIFGISDRILVIKQNNIQAELDKISTTPNQVMSYAVGGTND